MVINMKQVVEECERDAATKGRLLRSRHFYDELPNVSIRISCDVYYKMWYFI